MAPRIDWYYRRHNCQTCQKSDALLEQAGAKIAETADARKQRISPSEAIRMARHAEQLWVMKGRKLVSLEMRKDRPSDDELRKLLIGPSGNLRAPTIRRGTKLFVGFSDDAFEGHLLA